MGRILYHFIALKRGKTAELDGLLEELFEGGGDSLPAPASRRSYGLQAKMGGYLIMAHFEVNIPFCYVRS